MTQYKVVNFTDVQKNKDGQWYVNSADYTSYIITITGKLTGKAVCKALEEAEYLTTSNMRQLTVNFGESIIEVFAKKEHKPLCRLEEIPVKE